MHSGVKINGGQFSAACITATGKLREWVGVCVCAACVFVCNFSSQTFLLLGDANGVRPVLSNSISFAVITVQDEGSHRKLLLKDEFTAILFNNTLQSYYFIYCVIFLIQPFNV